MTAPMAEGGGPVMLTIESITLLAGFGLIIVGLVGGGLEVKEVKIPSLSLLPRAASFLIGCALIGLVFLQPGLFSSHDASSAEQPLSSAQNNQLSSNKRELGADIPNLLQVSDVKKILKRLGYYDGKTLDNDPDDAYFQAVANFQRDKEIKQDGLVGPETYAKLREAAPWWFGDKPQSVVSK
jgi:hypothetical protein